VAARNVWGSLSRTLALGTHFLVGVVFAKKRLTVETLLYKCLRMRIITDHVLPAKLRLHVTLHYTPHLLGVRVGYSTVEYGI
jgi:hypothetical protein